ncbi:hypothetical protein ACFX13_019478 [Malus domestica]
MLNWLDYISILFILLQPNCTMSSDNSTDGSCKSRRVLSDLTNRPIKRGFSMVSAASGAKSRDEFGKIVDLENRGSKFAKQLSLGVEDLVGEKCKTKTGADCNPEALSSPKGTQESVFSPTYSDIDDSSNDNSDSVTLTMSNDMGERSSDSGANAGSALEVSDALMDNCSSIASISKCSGMSKKDCCGGGGKCQYDKPGHISEVNQSGPLYEGLVTVVRGNNEKDLGGGKVATTKYDSNEWSRLPRSQSCSKSHEFKKLERCTTLKGGGSADLNVGDDLLKDCSCSFCLKAAHILSDLQYQDIKGRIAALKRSKKEASVLVEKSVRGKEINTKGQLHPNKASKSEYDLSSQWRSLFLNMKDVLVHESNHLEDCYVALKNLRDNCKTELEITSGMPSEKQ